MHLLPQIFDTDYAQFTEQVLTASQQQAILVDFWAEWCAPCHSLAPVLVKVLPEYSGRLRLAKVDADENMKLCGHYRLRGFPTLILFHHGEELGRVGGAQSPHELRRFLDHHLPPLHDTRHIDA